MSCPAEIVKDLVDGFASIEHRNSMAAFTFAVAGTALGVMIETAGMAGVAAILDVASEVHADHLRGPVHHPPTP